MREPSSLQEKVLRVFPAIRTLPEPSQRLLFSQAVRKNLDHKQVLVQGGNECAWLPLVLEGCLRVYKVSEAGRELTLYRIEQGESCILTTTCILNGGSFPAIAEAEGSTEVVLVPSRLLLRLFDEDENWRRFIFGLYSRRLEMVLTLVEEVAFHHVDARVADYLARWAQGSEHIVEKTHGEIAADLGTSREVVTRILRDLEAQGLVSTLRGRIRVLRPEDLGSLS